MEALPVHALSVQSSATPSSATPSSANAAMTFVGIDLARDSFQVAADTDIAAARFNASFVYDPAGITTLLGRLKHLDVAMIVMEATGGLERKLAAELTEAGYTVAVINPRQARDFAKALGKLAKTDKVDAEVLAQMGRILKPKARPLPSAEQIRLKDLSARRRQLIHMRTQEINRSQMVTLKDISQSIKRLIATIDREIAKIEKQIADVIDSNSDWKNKVDIMDSVKGIGLDTAHAILAELPEIGTLSRRQIANLAGLAPHAFQSGTFHGQSKIWGGRSAVRSALYMGTLAATIHNPAIKTFYNRLVEHGKKKIVAVTACMRKMLTILNALVRDRVKWNSEMALAKP